MKRNWHGWLFAACIVPATALAQAPAAPAKPDAAAKAQQIVSQVCAACHGADGNSVAAANPSLAGQPADYITRQLDHFKSGVRQSAVMQPMAATLSPDDMVALGAYFASQKAKPNAARDAALASAGRRIWRAGDTASGLPACGACHGPTGAGMAKNFPRLSGQHADYTYAQLKAFQSGARGNDKDGKDVNGRIMASVAKNLSDEQMKALAEYAAGVR